MSSGTRSIPSLKQNFIWTFAGNAIYGACQWGMLAVLAKLGHAEQVGTYALGVAISTPVFMLGNLHLREIQSTDARREFEFRQYLTLRLVTVGLGLVSTAGIAFFVVSEGAGVVFLVALVRGVESTADVIYGLLQRHERMDRISKSLALHGCLSLLGLALVFWWKGSLVWAIGGCAVGACVSLLYDLKSPVLVGERSPFQRDARRSYSLPGLLRMAWIGLPVGLVMMLVSLSGNIPRYFIERHSGAKALGIYAAMAYFMQVGTALVTALGQSASPRLARYFADANWSALSRLLRKLIGIAIALGIFGVGAAAFVGQPLLRILYGPTYASDSVVLVWLMVAAALSYISAFLGFAMVSMRRLSVQFPIFLTSTAVALLVCWYSVPTTGLVGAAFAMLASATTQVIGGTSVVLHALAVKEQAPELSTQVRTLSEM